MGKEDYVFAEDDLPIQEIEERPDWYPPRIIRRPEWGATDVETQNYDLGFSTEVLITFTDLDPCYTKEECIKTLQAAQKADKEAKHVDIKYNFYIGSDGNIYEGRGWLAVPDVHHEFGSSRGRLLAVGLVGRRGDVLEKNRIQAFKDLLAIGKENWLISAHPKIHRALRIMKVPDFIREMMEKHGPHTAPDYLGLQSTNLPGTGTETKA